MKTFNCQFEILYCSWLAEWFCFFPPVSFCQQFGLQHLRLFFKLKLTRRKLNFFMVANIWLPKMEGPTVLCTRMWRRNLEVGKKLFEDSSLVEGFDVFAIRWHLRNLQELPMRTSSSRWRIFSSPLEATAVFDTSMWHRYRNFKFVLPLHACKLLTSWLFKSFSIPGERAPNLHLHQYAGGTIRNHHFGLLHGWEHSTSTLETPTIFDTRMCCRNRREPTLDFISFGEDICLGVPTSLYISICHRNLDIVKNCKPDLKQLPSKDLILRTKIPIFDWSLVYNPRTQDSMSFIFLSSTNHDTL